MPRVEIVADLAGYVVRRDGRDQSHVDLERPTRIVFDYVRRMADVVDLCRPPGEPVHLVHVGGAGLTLPRYVAATRPRSHQVVLEPDEELTALVRDRLPLPRGAGIKVRPVDGRSGQAGLRPGAADVLVLDAYDEGRVPADLVTAEAVAGWAAALAPDGLLLANLADRAPFAWTRRVVAGVRERLPELVVSAEPATLRGRRGGNLLLVASRVGLPVAALQGRAVASAAPYRVLEPGAVSDSLGGGTPFTDADAQPSPAP
ncbi:spermidine synthase [Nocardioides sp. SYSU D00038]|uniref:spermidine synthase n=1 Tax=Nocardioides sp. SYSU D00038 TaxID=2812554 RepID=UPI0019687D8D|nr:fused MFS/spermidine synthase [Nocardioides sp. SYSU D00038]